MKTHHTYLLATAFSVCLVFSAQAADKSLRVSGTSTASVTPKSLGYMGPGCCGRYPHGYTQSGAGVFKEPVKSPKK